MQPKIGTVKKFTWDDTEYDSLDECLTDAIDDIVREEIQKEVTVDSIDLIIKNLQELKEQCQAVM